jgi:catechol 2,3-dioxygenase-like lactoylglutathione lyase family enzyme
VIRVTITSVLVDDQAKALAFYTEKLGFVKKTDVPAGDTTVTRRRDRSRRRS